MTPLPSRRSRPPTPPFTSRPTRRSTTRLLYVDGVFALENTEIADSYRPFGRCLMVVDETVYGLYGEQMHAYFDHHGIALTVFPVTIHETDKTLRHRRADRRRVRRFRAAPHGARAGRRRRPDHRRRRLRLLPCLPPLHQLHPRPTTLIGLIDASVAIKVAVNHGKRKNRLGAFHASQKVILDFSFLTTLPDRPGAQRHGRADQDRGGRQQRHLRAAGEVRRGPAARPGSGTSTARRSCARSRDRVTYDAIDTMLRPRGAEPAGDRSRPRHRLRPHLEPDAGARPDVPFFHGHAINIDMALSTTLAEQRGYISISDRDRIFWLMSRLGLALDSPHLTAELLARGHGRRSCRPATGCCAPPCPARSAPATSSTT